MLETFIILACLAADQLTKYWAAHWLAQQPGRTLPLIQDVLHLTYVENPGAAFGILQNQRGFFVVMTIVVACAIVGILLTQRKKLDRWMRVGLSFMLCGALGNFIDRLVLHYVRDFVDFRLINFAVFNVADMCLTVAVIMVGIHVLFMEKQESKDKPPAQATNAERKAVENTEE